MLQFKIVGKYLVYLEIKKVDIIGSNQNVLQNLIEYFVIFHKNKITYIYQMIKIKILHLLLMLNNFALKKAFFLLKFIMKIKLIH